MACLDLHYHVTVRRNVQKKSETKEASILPVDLSELQDNEELTETVDAGGMIVRKGQVSVIAHSVFADPSPGKGIEKEAFKKVRKHFLCIRDTFLGIYK